eukprot:1250225-Pyramimonas_sp.AAC.1
MYRDGGAADRQRTLGGAGCRIGTEKGWIQIVRDLRGSGYVPPAGLIGLSSTLCLAIWSSTRRTWECHSQ